MAKAQNKQKKLYDRKHSNPCKFAVWDKLVINQSINQIIINTHALFVCINTGWGPGTMKDFRRKKRKGGKLHVDDRWLGPYQVSKDLGKGFYSLTRLLLSKE